MIVTGSLELKLPALLAAQVGQWMDETAARRRHARSMVAADLGTADEQAMAAIRWPVVDIEAEFVQVQLPIAALPALLRALEERAEACSSAAQQMTQRAALPGRDQHLRGMESLDAKRVAALANDLRTTAAEIRAADQRARQRVAKAVAARQRRGKKERAA